MKKLVLSLCVATALFSCSDDDNAVSVSDVTSVTVPASYSFVRNGNTSVSYSGQTDRINMAEEVVSALGNPNKTEAQIDAMFDHKVNNADFTDTALNASTKSVKSKIAASNDYFSGNTTDQAAIRADLDTYIKNQVDVVFPNWNTDAVQGIAGKIQQAGGGTTRYVNAKGLEYTEAFAKGVIGGLMVDQILNNYLSTAVLDAGSNKADNDAGILASGKNYTTMEHKWDEAFGYLYGKEADATMPTLGADGFLNEYLGDLEADTDFKGISAIIYNAFKLGRQAIIEKKYTVRDAQANIIKAQISKIVGVKAVHYLQQGKIGLTSKLIDRASVFHDLTEGYGFVYSLQFTRIPGTDKPYFTKTEVDELIATLEANNGFWDITTTSLETMSNTISAEFDFTTAQAAN